MAPHSRLVKRGVSPSLVCELAWLLDLLVQTAPYAEPALAELGRSLLPGVEELRPSIRARFAGLWNDSLAGCPELLVAAAAGNQLEDRDMRGIAGWLSSGPKETPAPQDLLTERSSDRRLIRQRLSRLDSDIRVRRKYRDILEEIWTVAEAAWQSRGRAVAAKASVEWTRKLESVRSPLRLVKLMPPRHPLTNHEHLTAVLQRRKEFTLVPVYFCMSGGTVTDLGDRILVCVPASALEPVRRTRDAAFLADRARILSEPTRVHILIHLMSAQSGVMEITRALGMSQPVVSEHVRVLARAGLIRRETRRGRAVYRAYPARIERIFEDARATLVRWAV